MENRSNAIHNVLAGRAFIGSCALLLCALAGQAAPFKPNPASFASWLNATDKREGGKAVVHDLAKCSHDYYTLEPVIFPNGTVAGPSGNYEKYECDIGYVTETSPLGKQRCRLSRIWWEKNLQTGSVSTRYFIDTDACRYLN